MTKPREMVPFTHGNLRDGARRYILVCLTHMVPSRKRQILARQCDTGADPVLPCADPESFVRGGPTLTKFDFHLFLDEGREDPNTTINRPSSARQRNAI